MTVQTLPPEPSLPPQMSSSRPTTPGTDTRRHSRRHSRRSSGVAQQQNQQQFTPQSPFHYPVDANNLPMDSPFMVEKFKAIADSMEELDLNMRDLQQIHSAISSLFNESFASFLYGLSITMWCVDFASVPSRDEWARIEADKKRKDEVMELKRRLDEAERMNQDLKARLAQESKQNQAKTDVAKRARGQTNNIKENTTYRVSKPASNQGDFRRVSRIPQPTIARSIGATREAPKTGPNLNQPPRYMKGLYDQINNNNNIVTGGSGTNLNPISKRSAMAPPSSRRPMKSSQRPPFR